MNRTHLFFLICYVVVLLWSAINPHDYLTWILESFPGIIGAIVLIAIYRKFQFTDLVYVLILIHCSIVFIGGKYTYAENPLFNYFKDQFHLERNNYDKLGHFIQGMVPSLIMREILIRLEVLSRKKWIPFFMIATAMLISSCYELLEWLVSELTGSAGDAFLGTQGYIWDTQSDMLYALMGSLFAVLFLSRLHDTSLKRKLAGES